MKLLFSKNFKQSIRKIDKHQAKLIKNWIDKNLNNMIDPRSKGKALTGSLLGFWRYRIGDYRLIIKIKDNELLIILIDIAHRKDVYRKK
ncbi:MAG: type II toxin-antitoxin system RelE/ParE family toxin [Lactobacillales bacterium]|jgi:mRNA interferase RelE/StbE|nr:type II toxin-antitoxin system RelE/ParE family toxin [Lactobacillales bacterium]